MKRPLAKHHADKNRRDTRGKTMKRKRDDEADESSSYRSLSPPLDETYLTFTNTPRAHKRSSGTSQSSSSAPNLRRSTPRKNKMQKTSSSAKQGRKLKEPTRRDVLWMRDVLRLQNEIKNQIPKLPFSRLVRESLRKVGTGVPYMVTKEALVALQESAELYLTFFFEDANRLALHAKRVTLMPKDMQLVFLLRSNWGTN